MATTLSDDKMDIIRRHVERVKNSTNMEVFRSMYKKMKLTFGEENVQIKRIDEEYVLKKLEETGHLAVATTYTQAELDNILKQICVKYELLMRFPELTISNSRGSTTVVRDVFVRLMAHPNGKLWIGMEGLATTFTSTQFSVGYLHSHLVPQDLRRPPVFAPFCLGQGPVLQVLHLLAVSYNEVNFGMLCVHIKNFLEWESLEGVPHMKMDTIPARTNQQLPAAPTYTATIVAPIVEGLIRKFRELPLSEARDMIEMSADDYSIVVQHRERLETWAAEQIERSPMDLSVYTHAVSAFLTYRDHAGRYVAFDASNGVNVKTPTRAVLNFRGEDVKVKIIDNENNLKRTKYANPKIIEQFCSKLSEELTIRAIEYTETGDGNPSDNIGQTANADPNPVPESIPA